MTWLPRRPTAGGAGGSRLELCQKLMGEAARCLESLDKQCAMRKIEELVRNQCHDGRIVGGEVANEVKELIHRLWVICDYVEKCKLLKLLIELGVTKTWLIRALHKNRNTIEWYLRRYGLR